MGLGFSRHGTEDEPDEPVVVNDHNIQIDEDIDSLEVKETDSGPHKTMEYPRKS